MHRSPINHVCHCLAAWGERHLTAFVTIQQTLVRKRSETHMISICLQTQKTQNLLLTSTASQMMQVFFDLIFLGRVFLSACSHRRFGSRDCVAGGSRAALVS